MSTMNGNPDIEECELCSGAVTRETKLDEDRDLALCNAHWNRWLVRYLGTDDAPCAARRIEATS